MTPLAAVPMVLVISPEKKIKTLQELVAYAKARTRRQLNYAAAGLGTPPHLTMERLRVAAGFTGQVVPFKGAPEALTEVLAGRVDVYFSPLPPAVQLIESGQLIPLAVSSVKRVAALPNVPTTTEAGFPNSDFDFYSSLFVPKQTPRDVVARIHETDAQRIADARDEGAVQQARRRAPDHDARGVRCADCARDEDRGRACPSNRSCELAIVVVRRVSKTADA